MLLARALWCQKAYGLVVSPGLLLNRPEAQGGLLVLADTSLDSALEPSFQIDQKSLWLCEADRCQVEARQVEARQVIACSVMALQATAHGY